MIAAAILLALGPADTVPPPETCDGDVVVTGSRTGGTAATTVSTIGRDDLDRLQPASLLEALNEVAGVRAVSTGGPGGGSFLSIRGGEPNFTLVLIDGVRVNDPTNSKGGAFDFGEIDPLLVDGVDLHRGAGSAIHGSDALSGVVDLRLRDPAPRSPLLFASMRGSTAGEIGGTLGLNRGWADGGVMAAGGWFDSGDQNESSLRRAQGLARARQQVGTLDLRLFTLYAHTDRKTFPEDSGGPLLAVNRDRETGSGTLWVTGFSLRGTGAGIRPNLSIGYSRQHDDSDTPGIAPGVLDAVPALAASTRFSRLEATGYLSLDRGWISAAAGGGVLREKGRSTGTIDFGFPLPVDFALARTTLSGFAEATLRPADGLSLDAAGRYDSVEHGTHRWTGGASIAWRLAPDAPTVFARIGTGFKLPSLYALGHPLIGNPALRPERNRDLEAGAEWRPTSDSRLRIAWFENRFTDLIDFDPLTFQTVNRALVTTRGVEAEGKVRIAAVTLSGSVAHLDIDSATPLRGRPHWQGSLRTAWTVLPALELNGALRFNSRFNDSSIPTGAVVTAGHAEGDLGLLYRLSPALRVAATLRNLADSRAQDAVGFPSIGRSARVTISFSGL
jgi:outer membrane cobalamin receptor